MLLSIALASAQPLRTTVPNMGIAGNARAAEQQQQEYFKLACVLHLARSLSCTPPFLFFF